VQRIMSPLHYENELRPSGRIDVSRGTPGSIQSATQVRLGASLIQPDNSLARPFFCAGRADALLTGFLWRVDLAPSFVLNFHSLATFNPHSAGQVAATERKPVGPLKVGINLPP
jgi:hypothetical protein